MKPFNKKGISALTTVILIVIIVVVIGAAIGLSMPPAATASNPVVAYIDTIEQTNNYTIPETLNWGATTPGNTYTKNFTVLNTGAQAVTLKLYTTEPLGCTQSWSKNGTVLSAGAAAYATLTLTLSELAQTGTFTWRLLTVNGTVADPTPTPTPTAETLQVTVDADTGCENITVTIVGDSITLVPSMLPATFNFTAGSDITFKTYALETDTGNYTFNAWLIDGATFKSGNPYTMQNVNASTHAEALYNAPS